ncbi:hypothetical protein [Deinococcus aerophilus]|uniref:Uncharacterized protein n=1 Tax=Deinococcus aerophilus TaxID=522488 RepID=A0ABQ2GK00_9DEIO|nr:hypothetical protein [Deinococcus aerophilus]GGM00082.1 hypothetical protein GCM10010841_05830 [Deinococcus aerophilus]
MLGRERILIVHHSPAAYLAEVRHQDTELQVQDLRVVASYGHATLIDTMPMQRQERLERGR